MNPAERLDTVAKAQYVRLIDIFVLGPALLYTAAILPKDRPLLCAFMVVAGAGTVYYNARNYVDIRRLTSVDPVLARDAWARLP